MNDARSVPEAVSPDSPRRVDRPVMLQRWYDLTALHWPYEAADVQAQLPEGFVVDTFGESAWIGLIAFEMQRVRVPGIPALGSMSTFPETNVRTYIVDPRGRRGVWFLSLDVPRLVPALVARATYGLPYCWSAMTIDRDGDGEGATRRYTSRRRWPPAEASSLVAVRVGRPLEGSGVSALDHFLTARWAFGSKFGRRLLWAEVDHSRWPLHAAEVIDRDERIVRATGLPPPVGDPIARWSPGLQVRVSRPRRVHTMPRG
jgi:uncharacterized protein